MDRHNRPRFICIPPGAKMCCFPLKRRTPPSHSSEKPIALSPEDRVPSPGSSNKRRSSFRLSNNLLYPPTPPITPDSLKHPERNPFETDCPSTSTSVVTATATPSHQAWTISLPSTPETPRIRALLVDDNTVNLDILSRVLKSHHFSPFASISARSFTSPLEALAHLEEDDYDIILLDIDMPELSGVETAIAIRDNSNSAIRDANRRAPIVAVTTNDGPEARQTYKMAGMVACVGKPLKVMELKLVIDSILGSQK